MKIITTRFWFFSTLLLVAAFPVIDGCITPESDERELNAAVVHGDRVTDIAFSADGRYLASAGRDNVIRVLDVHNFHRNFIDPQNVVEMPSELPISPLVGHGTGFSAIVFAPNQTVLASGNYRYVAGGTVQLWDMESGEEIGVSSGYESPIRTLNFDPLGHVLAVGDGEGLRFGQTTLVTSDLLPTDVSFGRTMGGIFDAVFSPDGTLVATAAADGTLAIWNAADGTLLSELTVEAYTPYSLAFSPDGTTLAAAGEDRGNIISGAAGIVRLWNITTFELEHTFDVAPSPLRAIAVSPDGSMVASAGDDRVIYLVDTRSSMLVDTLKGHVAKINCLAFSSNGLLVASGSDDRYVRLWYVGDLTGQTCDDTMDNDGDGWTDGEDPNCADGGLREIGLGTTECNDGLDNDSDTYRDSADPDCANGLGDNEGPDGGV